MAHSVCLKLSPSARRIYLTPSKTRVFIQQFCSASQTLGNNSQFSDETLQQNVDHEVEEFRTYEIPGLKIKEKPMAAARQSKPVAAPRSMKMPTNQDWTNVWPAAGTFKQSVVPLPLRQGYAKNSGENRGISPTKFTNAELMKIPNFLHLTESHVKKHCTAIKQFCTEWPVALHTDEDCERHFPVETKLSRLKLDDHARDKFIQLVGDRYNKHTDTLTLTANRCPSKCQNYDYLQYLLTACYFESHKTEAWEAGRTAEDTTVFTWDMTPSKDTVLSTLKAIQKNESSQSEDMDESVLLERDDVRGYRDAVSNMADEGENCETIREYKRSVLRMLRIPVVQA